MKFLAEGKKVELFEDTEIMLEADKLDRKYLERAQLITPRRYKVFERVFQMLKNGASRQEVVDFMTAQAVAKKLSQ